MGEAISTESRSLWNAYVDAGKYTGFISPNCFSPVLDILRDPRWGRCQVAIRDVHYTGLHVQGVYTSLGSSCPNVYTITFS